MGELINWLSSLLGLLMDLFFRGFTAVGYPRLWVCVVAFAATTRLIFLPEKINSHKVKLLSPVVNYELKQVDPDFFEKTKDKELTVKRSLLKKEVFRKYKLSNNSGCLTSLIQYPIFVALFYVVKNPQEFVPSLESISVAVSNVNIFLGIPLSAIPLMSRDVAELSWMIIVVPSLVMLSSFFKMFPTVKAVMRVGKLWDKIKTCLFSGLMLLLLGWCSSTLPLVISVYWITNDIANTIIDRALRKILPKTKFISSVLNEHRNRVNADAEVALAVNSNPCISDT